MLPTNNSNNLGCTPMSSNCVIWQGPDIACLNLCKGDTITDVTYKLAVEVCNILNLLSPNSYDVTCLNLPCAEVKDISELIQILINKICDLQECCDNQQPSTEAGCPDCIVPIASCFYFQNPQGDTETTMQLSDYITAIGNRICSQEQAVSGNTSSITQLSSRVQALEDAPAPELDLPFITPNCVLSPDTPVRMDILLIALEEQFCELSGATGSANQLYVGMGRQPVALNAAPRLAPGGGSMSSIVGWETIVNNLGDSIGNLWLTVEDIRSAVRNIKLNCCPSGCDGIILNMQAAMTSPTNLVLYFTGTIPSGFAQCNPLGTRVTVRDTEGAEIIATINLAAVINDPSGFVIDLTSTPLNTQSIFTIVSTVCLEDTTNNITCQQDLTFVLNNTLTCPTVNYIAGVTTVDYAITHVSGTVDYIVELYNNATTVLIASQTVPASAPGTYEGQFTALIPNTSYKVRVKVSSGDNETPCPFSAVTTLPAACPAPSSVTAELIIP